MTLAQTSHRRTRRTRATFALLATVIILAPTSTTASQSPNVTRSAAGVDSTLARRIARIEQSLRGAVTITNAPRGDMSLAARMRHYRVPGLSVAVVDGYEVAWARAYGVAKAGDHRPLTPTTLLQAGSISKPTAAVGALRLVQCGAMALDAPVEGVLRSWRIPAPVDPGHRPLSLRDLLTHSASLTVHGFPGYARGSVLPTVRQVLDGQAPANTPAIVRDGPPGVAMRYSGGGYTVLQQAMEDVTGVPFARFMESEVFRPAGMRLSTFAPLSADHEARAAIGHREDGSSLAAGWHDYPEQAAASLWSTPSELGRLVAEISRAYVGRGSSLLAETTARAMLTPSVGDAGLGIFIKTVRPGLGRAAPSDRSDRSGATLDRGPKIRFSHTGSTEGYTSIMIGYPERGQGIVVMTNSDNGSELAMEVVRAVAAEYEWPDLVTSERIVTSLSEASRAALVGAYDLPGGRGYDVAPAPADSTMGSGLRIALRGRGWVPMYAESDSTFFLLVPGTPTVRVIRDAANRVTELVLQREDQVTRARRRE